MSSSRLLPRILIILLFAVIGVGIGVTLQALRITKKPQEFRSLAKLVAGGQMVPYDSMTWREQQVDFYGTIIETIESAEMSRRALERVRALNPDLKDSDVAIRAVQTKGSAIINILASGPEPKYTRIFLDALLDEFIAFRQNIAEQAQGKVLQQFLQSVVFSQSKMEKSMQALEAVRSKVESVSVKSDRDRIVTRLNSLRNQRDDLNLELKPMAESDLARPPLKAKQSAIETEIQVIEAQLQHLEPGLSELRMLTEKHAAEKEAYERTFEQVEKIQSAFNSRSDYVAVQERATPASENVEDWVLPVVVGACGGGLLGGLVGLVLSFLIVRSPKPPQIPTTVG